MTPYDWYSDDPDNKVLRRNAANAFLSTVLDDPEGIGAAVTGMGPDQKKNARDQFEKALKDTSGGCALPKGVEVICIEADTRKRADLVVFVLRKKGAQDNEPLQQLTSVELGTKSDKELPLSTTPELWVRRWIAAWAPY